MFDCQENSEKTISNFTDDCSQLVIKLVVAFEPFGNAFLITLYWCVKIAKYNIITRSFEILTSQLLMRFTCS